jgi:predicted acetyltransferase
MPEREEKARANIEVIAATVEQQPILANLLQLYAHDFSEFHDVELGADGRFVYPSLPLYWSQPERYPFLVRVDGQLAGFVLVKQGSELTDNAMVWDMAEFFVIRGYRRRGIGTRVAREIWNRFPGPWEVRVMQSNVSAQRFWTQAISEFCSAEVSPALVQKDQELWNVFSFASTSGIGPRL